MSTAAPLHGTGVLVTRPEQQADGLCRLFQSRGASVYRLPAMTIVEHPQRRQALAAQRDQPDPDLIIFTSANAVRFGEPVLAQRRDLALAAIGPATARALNQAGYRVAVLPEAGFDSEALLAMPRLANLSGMQVLLVKGEGGREVLRQELQARGATVRTLAVYQRRPATPSHEKLGQIEQAFDARLIQLITATSLELARYLLELAPPNLRQHFERAAWITPGARVSQALASAGIRGPFIDAASAENQDLLAAALRWRSSASGA